MSGGHFEYYQFKIGEIKEEVEKLISERKFSEKTINTFKQAAYHLEMAEIYTQRIDWLVSGDDSEEDFHEILSKETFDVTIKHMFRDEVERGKI